MADSVICFVTTYKYDEVGRLVGQTNKGKILGREPMAEYLYELGETGLLSRVVENVSGNIGVCIEKIV